MIAAINPLALAAAGVLIVLGIGAYLIGRRRGPQGPDIPPAFAPGPSDAQLEKPRLEKLQAWGIVILVLTAIWLPGYFLFEAQANVSKEEALIEAAVEHGRLEVQIFDEHSNPAGIGCTQCHGTDLQGQEVMKGTVVFQSANLTTVCSRLTQAEIRETIKQGRAPNMPAWGVEFNGALNDQQVDDIVAYLAELSRDTVPMADNKCLNKEAAAPKPAADASPSADASPEADASPAAAASPAAEASPSPAAA